MAKGVGVEVRASKRYREDFVRELEEGIRDILEGRFVDLEGLYEKYGVKPGARARKTA